MSENVREVSDSSFEADVLKSRPAGAGRFLGRLVRAVPHARADRRSRRRQIRGDRARGEAERGRQPVGFAALRHQGHSDSDSFQERP